jgi:hypothetical protein
MSSRADAEAKQDQARSLLIAGATYQQIADSPDPTAPPDAPRRLYASPGAARNAVLAADRRHGGLPAVRQRETRGGPPAEVSTAERRSLLRARHERLLAAVMPRAMTGNGEAIDRATRLLGQMADLDGLKIRPAAPVLEVGGEEDDPVDELRRRREARAHGRGSAAPPA